MSNCPGNMPNYYPGNLPKYYSTKYHYRNLHEAGTNPGFQVRGGGGALKKTAPSGGRRENFWGISCEKSRFYAKKLYFFQF